MAELTPPSHLSEAAAQAWRAVIEASRSPERIAAAELEAYAGQVARLREAQRRIDTEGLVVADAKGNPVPHPAIELERKAQAEVRAWAGKFR